MSYGPGSEKRRSSALLPITMIHNRLSSSATDGLDAFSAANGATLVLEPGQPQLRNPYYSKGLKPVLLPPYGP